MMDYREIVSEVKGRYPTRKALNAALPRQFQLSRSQFAHLSGRLPFGQRGEEFTGVLAGLRNGHNGHQDTGLMEQTVPLATEQNEVRLYSRRGVRDRTSVVKALVMGQTSIYWGYVKQDEVSPTDIWQMRELWGLRTTRFIPLRECGDGKLQVEDFSGHRGDFSPTDLYVEVVAPAIKEALNFNNTLQLVMQYGLLVLMLVIPAGLLFLAFAMSIDGGS